MCTSRTSSRRHVQTLTGRSVYLGLTYPEVFSSLKPSWWCILRIIQVNENSLLLSPHKQKPNGLRYKGHRTWDVFYRCPQHPHWLLPWLRSILLRHVFHPFLCVGIICGLVYWGKKERREISVNSYLGISSAPSFVSEAASCCRGFNQIKHTRPNHRVARQPLISVQLPRTFLSEKYVHNVERR